MENLVQQFIETLSFEKLSKWTVQGYSKSVLRFLGKYNISAPADISRNVIESHFSDMRSKNLGEGYIVYQLWAIRKFTKFLNEKGMLEYRWDISIPVAPEPEMIEYLEQEELEKLIETIDLSDIHGLRLRTFIEVMLNTGLRPSETLSLNREHIIGNEFEITGKGKKTRKVYLNERAREWIDRYLGKRKDSFPALFVTHCKARRLSLRHAETTFKECLKKANILKRVRLHDLRHTYGTNLLIHGCPIDYVAVLMGHSKVETTRRHYLAVRQKHAKEAHFKYLDFARY